MAMTPSGTPSTNWFALASAGAAVFTFLSFCIGVAPIPLTAWLCFPSALVLGLAAAICGILALRQMRTSGEKGRALALFGMWTGILTMLAVLCFTVLSLGLLFYGAGALNNLWPHIKP
jgi:hypothetical protein